jgi:hypothetical protein
MQWMNQSGTLKITHKLRVKFSVGNYVDIVDFDVAPLSTFHLLLGRPWLFDFEVTHGDRFNNYSFAHKGVHHVLKPMTESAIKVDIFPEVRNRKRDLPMDTSKPRTALFQKWENDVSVLSLKIPGGDVQTDCNVTNDSYLKVGSIAVHLNEKNGNNILSDFMPMEHTFVGGEFKNNHHNTIDIQKSNLIDTLSNPRLSLIQGRENDEPINHQFHSVTYVEESDNISVVMSKKKLFVGANMCEGPEKATRGGGGGVNGSQSKFLDRT